MKENYSKPIAELEEFRTVDVITTSPITETDDNDVHWPTSTGVL